MNQNEIRDYLERAPKRWQFNGNRLLNNTHVRFVWLASMARGTLDQRINRRAGIDEWYRPFHNTAEAAWRRHMRRVWRINGYNWSPY